MAAGAGLAFEQVRQRVAVCCQSVSRARRGSAGHALWARGRSGQSSLDKAVAIGDRSLMLPSWTAGIPLLACLLLAACGPGQTAVPDASTGAASVTGGTSGAPPTTTAAEDTTTPPTTGAAGLDSDSDPGADTSSETATDPTGHEKVCWEECAVDGDCTIDGIDKALKCVDGRCGRYCSDNADCVAQISGWYTACVSQGDCPGQVCVDIGGGRGRCATALGDGLMCPGSKQVAVMYPVLEGRMSVTVCAYPDWMCIDGGCMDPCADDSDCDSDIYTKCFPNGQCGCADDAACFPDRCYPEGHCGCGSDADCDGDLPKCDTDTGFCGCFEDANCVAAGQGDVCIDGRCWCSDASACTHDKLFGGTVFVCEAYP